MFLENLGDSAKHKIVEFITCRIVFNAMFRQNSWNILPCETVDHSSNYFNKNKIYSNRGIYYVSANEKYKWNGNGTTYNFRRSFLSGKTQLLLVNNRLLSSLNNDRKFFCGFFRAVFPYGEVCKGWAIKIADNRFLDLRKLNFVKWYTYWVQK